MSDYAGWAQAGVAGLIAAVGTVFWAGSANTRITEQHQAIVQLQNKQSADHDKVTTLQEDVAQIKSDTAETKSDVKQILQNQSDVKDALTRYNHRAK